MQYALVCFSALIYVKYIFLWLLAMLADYMLEFRFEYFWPFWLFIRSVYDSFKYQGMVKCVVFLLYLISSNSSWIVAESKCSGSRMICNVCRYMNCRLVFQAFSTFFVCIAATSDFVWYLVIPVQWLFFFASTYVWVQYVWHTGDQVFTLERLKWE